MSKGTAFISSSRPQISADSGTFRGEKGELDYVGGRGGREEGGGAKTYQRKQMWSLEKEGGKG